MTPELPHPLPRPRSNLTLPTRQPGVLVAAAGANHAVLAASLEAGGFNTWTATDGFKAFDTFLRHTGEIDLVLIGSDLPDVPAAALARRIRVNFPGIPCAFFAGSRNPDCDDALRRLGAEPVPLAFPELLEALHELAATDTGVPS